MAAKSEQRLPDSADCTAENDAGGVDLRSTKNVKWVAKLGHLTTGSPVVSRGKVFIGTSCEDGRDAGFLCLDEETGRLLGCFICPRPRRGNLETWAISSTPTVDDDRLYFVSPYQEAMCIDLKILLGTGHHRKREDASRSARTDRTRVEQLSLRSVLWRYDMSDKLKAYYHHTASPPSSYTGTTCTSAPATGALGLRGRYRSVR